MGSFYFFHIIFSCRKLSHLSNTIGICCDCSNLFVSLIIIFAYSISRFDILSSKYIKGNILKISGHVFKQMLYGTFHIVQKCYFIQKLTVFVDDQKTRRYFIFHFHLLNLCGIFNLEFHIGCFQIAIRGNLFPKDIFFSYCQTLDHMWLIFYRSPLIYNVSVFIKNRQLRSIQFHSCGQIGFCYLYCCWLVLFHNFQFHNFYVLSLVGSIKFQNFIGRYESSWCF